MRKTDIKSLTGKQLEAFVAELGEKSFRGKQIFQWLHSKQADSFEQMTSLSKPLRERLTGAAFITKAEIIEKYSSENDQTIKYLFRLENNYIIESVLMRYDFGNTVCVSTQAGCRMGCSFCASTINGLDANLTAGEILSQVYGITLDTGERISNIVLMGSGEPLDNFDAVMAFINIINDAEGMNIGQRHITISTCGIVDKIYELADRNLQVTLAVSLHAPNDQIRTQLIPIARKYPMATLLEACKYYINKTNRRITFEYALIDSVNDSEESALELASILKGLLCHVNLIPVNEVRERRYQQSSKRNVQLFGELLTKQKIETTVRRKLGGGIDAACGQLRNRHMSLYGGDS